MNIQDILKQLKDLPSDWDGWAPKQQLAEGIAKNRADFREDLVWIANYYINKEAAMTQLAKDAGIDNGSVSKVFSGKYVNGGGLVLAPPNKLIRYIRVLRQNTKDLREIKDRVFTPTVEKIWSLCHKVGGRNKYGEVVPGTRRLIGNLFANSHVGKTEALKWYREKFNHGSTVYVDLQGCSGTQDIWREFAKSCGYSGNAEVKKLKHLVMESLTRDTLVIIDEFHHITYSYQRRASIRMVNEIKSIHDRTGCPMVICATDVAREDIDTGEEQKHMAQIKRRGNNRLCLPATLPVYDVRVIAEHYGLSFPDAPKPARDKDGRNRDTWKKLTGPYSEAQLKGAYRYLAICHDIAVYHGIEHLFATIDDGRIMAKKRGEDFSWDFFVKAYDRVMGQSTPDEV